MVTYKKLNSIFRVLLMLVPIIHILNAITKHPLICSVTSLCIISFAGLIKFKANKYKSDEAGENAETQSNTEMNDKFIIFCLCLIAVCDMLTIVAYQLEK